MARALVRVWGSLSLDLFATHLNAKLPLCCSLVPDPQAIFEDAFRHPWDNLDVYAFPPFPLVGRVVARVRETPNLSTTPVDPLWPAEGVVCGPPPSADPTASGANPVGLAALAAPLQPLPPGRPHAEPSRLATLERLLRKSGFSRGPALEISGCVQESTACLYQAKWLSFCGWCRRRGVAPVNATVPLIVDFFIHLCRDRGLSVSAIKGYHATLNSVLTLKGLDLAASRELSMLFRSFSRSVHPGEQCPPAWDVTLVLQSLTGPPYEPLRTVDERFLAHKTLFLLALASAKRVGGTPCPVVLSLSLRGLE